MAGHLLKEWREHAGLSQSELGALLKCSQANIGKIERGEGRPGVDIALRLKRLSKGLIPVEAWESTAEAKPAKSRAATRRSA
jgi:transcriptional regulator with XRE-family HTH domain